MSVKSSTIRPTKIGSTGNVKGSVTGSKGPQWDHLPGSESFANANVNRRSVTQGVPAGEQKHSQNREIGPGSGERANPKGRQIPGMPGPGAKKVP